MSVRDLFVLKDSVDNGSSNSSGVESVEGLFGKNVSIGFVSSNWNDNLRRNFKRVTDDDLLVNNNIIRYDKDTIDCKYDSNLVKSHFVANGFYGISEDEGKKVYNLIVNKVNNNFENRLNKLNDFINKWELDGLKSRIVIGICSSFPFLALYITTLFSPVFSNKEGDSVTLTDIGVIYSIIFACILIFSVLFYLMFPYILRLYERLKIVKFFKNSSVLVSRIVFKGSSKKLSKSNEIGRVLFESYGDKYDSIDVVVDARRVLLDALRDYQDSIGFGESSETVMRKIVIKKAEVLCEALRSVDKILKDSANYNKDNEDFVKKEVDHENVNFLRMKYNFHE